MSLSALPDKSEIQGLNALFLSVILSDIRNNRDRRRRNILNFLIFVHVQDDYLT